MFAAYVKASLLTPDEPSPISEIMLQQSISTMNRQWVGVPKLYLQLIATSGVAAGEAFFA